MKSKVVFACALLVIASPASADWQYVKWGMTPKQLVAASNGEAALGHGTSGDKVDKEEVGAVGTYRDENNLFRSVFYFRDNRLNQIVLVLQGNDTGTRCQSILSNFKATYGEPDSSSSDMVIHWKDQQGRNIVKLVSIGDMCDIHFEESGAHGLSL